MVLVDNKIFRPQKKMKIKNICIIFLAVIFEYLRDYIFINLNIYADFKQNLSNGLNVINYTDTKINDLIKDFSLSSISKIKWVLSIGFAAFFFLIGILLSKINFNQKHNFKFIYLLSLGGLFILTTSFLIFFIGQHLNIENENNFYSVSLELSHFVQSSLFPISFFLIYWSINKNEVFKLKSKNKEKDK